MYCIDRTGSSSEQTGSREVSSVTLEDTNKYTVNQGNNRYAAMECTRFFHINSSKKWCIMIG